MENVEILENEIRKLREALEPFAKFNDTLKLWRSGMFGEIQAAWPHREPILSRTFPISNDTIRTVRIYSSDFEKAETVFKNLK